MLVRLRRYRLVAECERDFTAAQIFVENEAGCEAVTGLRSSQYQDIKGKPSLTLSHSVLRGQLKGKTDFIQR